jgi:hypothetical protein
VNEGAHKELPECEWELEMSCAMTDSHFLVYREKALKATLTIFTPKNKASGNFGDSKQAYELDGDKREFSSEDELRRAIIEGPKELWVYAGSTRVTADGEDNVRKSL